MTPALVALAVYAALLLLAGALVARRVRRGSDFFVASRALPVGLVFTTLLAANIGAGSTVGATGLAFRYGWSAWWWSGSAALGCLILGLCVAPRLHRLAAEGGHLTVGDFLEARFDGSVRALVSVVLALASLLILAGQIIAMAWALEVMAGVPKPWGCALSAALVVGYVGGGGLLASAWVNLLELVVLLVGFALAVPYAWDHAGGWTGVTAAAPEPMPAPLLFGLLVTLVPSFIVSPGLVQKTWGARSASSARRAVLLNAAALAVFACVPVLLGVAARQARPALGHAEMALPALLGEVLPPWLGGLGLAALFAAEISTADAVLFMLSTSLGRDLYQRFLRPDADDARLLRVGRRATLVAGLLGVTLALFVPSVVDALRGFYGVLTVALFAPLIAGLYSRRATAGRARVAIVAAVATMIALRLALGASPHAAWAPYLIATVLAFIILLWPGQRPPGGHWGGHRGELGGHRGELGGHRGELGGRDVGRGPPRLS